MQEIYLEILALDSLYGVLSWYERCWLHMVSIGKESGQPSLRIMSLYKVLVNIEWDAPKRRPGQDRCGQYFEDGKWLEIEHYPKNHPEITNQIRKYLE